MLDPRLVGKKLDVRIIGTREKVFYNGHYENQIGSVTLTKVPTNVEDSIMISIGFSQARRKFQLQYLHAEATTERPPFVTVGAISITRNIGQRVVIIGPDLRNDAGLIGNYGVVINSGWNLPPTQALVQICSSGSMYGKCAYFSEKSLCRSHQET
jgi:hypothetical protein